MSSGEQGVYKDLVNFFNSSRIFLINCQKPDRKGNLFNFFNRNNKFNNHIIY